MDVHNAFLHGDLEEEVYMKMPPGFQSADPNKVCRLRKSLYGLKQAPRCWFAKLSTALVDYGFEQSLGDYSLFTYEKGTTRLHLLVYVDDLIIAGSSLKATKSFKLYLSTCFHMKDLGDLKYFIGIEVARNSTGIYLCQRKYALDILAETGLLESKPVNFPLEQNHKLAVSKSHLLADPAPYRCLLGRLIYLGVTRPDLAFSVHVLAQFMQKPRLDHWFAALRVVRYLKTDPGQGILLRSDKNFQLTGWCDSDWGSCPLTRRSVTGYFVQFGDSPVSWKTRKQKTVSRSSAEAEYRAIAMLVQELIWLKRMLLTLGVLHPQSMIVFCDSKSAIYIATNPVFHERTKHIELDLHFVRDEVLTRNILLRHVDSKSQLADVLTKAIGRDGFEIFRSKLGIRNLYAPA
ncbi:Retrovirus-related Pol polyprotein from transposon RE2 [Cardamine amara subsp. amara]|uniref:Retrovirus-related Pol polyprotein from transposon RE2 n=1 Tax=Cardamine amara subsp. amara TaxID=228776 RepID=A0ABD1AWR5_CARAN